MRHDRFMLNANERRVLRVISEELRKPPHMPVESENLPSLAGLTEAEVIEALRTLEAGGYIEGTDSSEYGYLIAVGTVTRRGIEELRANVS